MGLAMTASNVNEFVHRVVSVVAEVEKVPPTHLPPLGDVIDLEALQRFLGSTGTSSAAEFVYLGRNVRVSHDGRITVSEPDRENGPYVGRCNTCGEEKRDVGLKAAQDFFASHANRSHAVEIFRTDKEGSDHSADTGETGDGDGST